MASLGLRPIFSSSGKTRESVMKKAIKRHGRRSTARAVGCIFIETYGRRPVICWEKKRPWDHLPSKQRTNGKRAKRKKVDRTRVCVCVCVWAPECVRLSGQSLRSKAFLVSTETFHTSPASLVAVAAATATAAAAEPLRLFLISDLFTSNETAGKE